MEHPYRVHSSIGFGFLHLLFMSSLAYPTPPPPVYHNTAVIRMMGTIYFTIFQDKSFYLKLECATILLEMICDVLYIRYIILDYTYLFGVIDVISNALICVFILLSIQNGDSKTKEIIDKIDEIRTTCISCCFGLKNNSNSNTSPSSSLPQTEYERPTNRAHMYKSIPSDDYNRMPTSSTTGTATAAASTAYYNEAPVYTFGGRQAFKPSFYNSSWGRDYIQAKVEREFDKVEKRETEIGDVGMITGADGTTQYIRFDEPDYKDYNSSGINHYANIFVSPYFTRDGTQITWFSGCSKIDKIGACLFIYNVVQFIYQLMMYSSIITSCRAFAAASASAATLDITTNHTNTLEIQRWLC